MSHFSDRSVVWPASAVAGQAPDLPCASRPSRARTLAAVAVLLALGLLIGSSLAIPRDEDSVGRALRSRGAASARGAIEGSGGRTAPLNAPSAAEDPHC